MKNKWLVPSYFKDFKCKCDKCRHTCCHGWQIPLKKEEYLKLISLNADENLRHRLDVSFITPDYIDEDHYRIISFNYLGDCPLQSNGLCLVQASQGEKLLPKVCRLYPRSLKKINGQLVASCSSACEAVVEKLLNEKALDLEYIEYDGEPSLSYEIDEDLVSELNNFESIVRNSKSLVKGIEDICLMINEIEFKKDFNGDENPLKIALDILNRLSNDEFLGDIIKEIDLRYKDNYFNYELDKDKFINDYPNYELYFRNVISNSLLFENFPFVDKRCDKTIAYKGLCASYGLLMLICVGYHVKHPSKDDLIDAIGALFHLIDHTSFYYNINVIVDSPALLLKL